MQVDNRNRFQNPLLAVVRLVTVDYVQEAIAHDVHPPSEYDEVRFFSGDDPPDFTVVVVSCFSGVGLQVGLQAEVGGAYGRNCLCSAGEAIGRFSVGENERDACGWQGRRILSIDESL